MFLTRLSRLGRRCARTTSDDSTSARKRRTRRLFPYEALEARRLLSTLPAESITATYFADRLVGDASPFGSPGPSGYTPAQVNRAYGFDQIRFPNNPLLGTGTTIAIVNAYHSPTIEYDLQQFNRTFGLPDPPSFTKLNQRGETTSFPRPDPGWIAETALDVQWAHAIAPGASILLVEADSNSLGDLLTAVDTARNVSGVVVISMSWGASEFSSQTSVDRFFTTPAGHSGVTFVAASGDTGAPASYPSASPNVISVGGTSLFLSSSQGDYGSESSWSGSGGGLSSFEPQPAYQKGVVTQSTTRRATPDVAYNGNPNTGFPVYDTYNNTREAPWSQFGGTSAGAPQWAALVAIANQGRLLAGKAALDGPGETLPLLYSMPASSFHDITTGSSSGSPRLFAGAGYDLVTGRGTPYANLVVSYLIGTTSGTIGDPSSGVQDLSTSFNRRGVVADGSTFSGGLDGGGTAYSANLLGSTVTTGGTTFTLGSPTGNNAVAANGQTIALTQGRFSTLSFLGAGVNGNQASQTFTVRYTDGSSQVYTQGLSDWYTPQSYGGESIAATTAYRNTDSGGRQDVTMNLYSYRFTLDASKVVSGITLPNNANVEILAINLLSGATIPDFAVNFNRRGVVADGSTFSGGLDGGGTAYSANLLGSTVTTGGTTFTLGSPTGNNAVAANGQTIALTQGRFSTLSFLGAGVNGNQASQTFTVRYTDGSSQVYTQGLSDWYTPQSYGGESIAATTAYRNTDSGGRQDVTMNLYSYRFTLDASKVVSGITLPNNANVLILAINLS